MRIKQKELEAMSKDELKERLNELRRELMRKNAEIATGTVPKNVGEVSLIKKNISRIMQSVNRKEVESKKQ